MILISSLFLIFIFSIQTIEATGPKDLNPEKTKADSNLSQNPAASGAKNKIDLKKDLEKTKKLSLKEKKALLKDIILEDASSSADLTDAEIQAIKLELAISEMDFILKGLKITIQDDQLKIAGVLKDFFENPNKIEALLNGSGFIEKVMEAIKADHKLTGEYSYFLKMGDADTGTFEIYFYKSPKDLKKDLKSNLVKQIILEKASSSEDLTDADKKYIQDQLLFKDIWISEGFKIRIPYNDEFKEKISDLIGNPVKMQFILNKAGFIEKIMEAIKADHKLTGEYSYSLKMEKSYSGAFEIYFYKNKSKSLKSIIIGNLANCRNLDKSEIAALKADSKIYDSKYISNACEILIEDRNLANLIGENKVESFKDTDYKQEIADRLNKANLNLDKHMSVYLKVQDMTKGQIGVILAETRSQKEAALIKTLELFRKNPANDINKNPAEKAYEVQYINLGISLYWEDNRFQSGGEFYQSLTLIDEIINNPKRRTAWINKANQQRRNSWKFQEALPNDENTIIRSRISLSGNLNIDFFTLIDSPELVIQSNILDWIDYKILKDQNASYASIRSSGDIDSFEAVRSLKQGLGFIQIKEDRLLEEGGTLSRYNSKKAMNKLLDDADFKRKVLDKINDYQENNQKFKETIDFVFSTDNLEDIKIKAQYFNESRTIFYLVVYELEPLEESDPTNPSAGESPAGGASAVDGD